MADDRAANRPTCRPMCIGLGLVTSGLFIRQLPLTAYCCEVFTERVASCRTGGRSEPIRMGRREKWPSGWACGLRPPPSDQAACHRMRTCSEGGRYSNAGNCLQAGVAGGLARWGSGSRPPFARLCALVLHWGKRNACPIAHCTFLRAPINNAQCPLRIGAPLKTVNAQITRASWCCRP
jgi:hypothetical protein